MPGHPVNLALFVLIVGMILYQGRLYLRHHLAFRLGFLGFWVFLGAELITEDRWLLVPAVACLVYGRWKYRRVGKDLEKWVKGEGHGIEASL